MPENTNNALSARFWTPIIRGISETGAYIRSSRDERVENTLLTCPIATEVWRYVKEHLDVRLFR
jgi:hypothetical protein